MCIRDSSKYPWLEWDDNAKVGKLLHVPERADIPENIKEHLIVELYSCLLYTSGVTVTLKDDVVTVKGPKGEMSQYVNPAINVAIEAVSYTHLIDFYSNI